MKQKRSFATIFLVLLVLGKVQACFCEDATVETSTFREYDEVFEGKVIGIKRFEFTKQHESGECFTFVGTETSFEVIKKWKGNRNKIIKVLQDGSTCSYDFLIDGYNYLITAYHRPFTNKEMNKQMPGWHLMTDVCLLNISQREEEVYAKAIEKLDRLFPEPISVQQKSNHYIIYSIIVLITALAFFKTRKNI